MQKEWTEKYRPRSLSDIVGHESSVRLMRQWAEAWKRGTPRSKALVLRGEPGTGKTSAALALASDFGWDVVEMNASDHRNADSIRRVAGMGAVSQTFSPTGEFLSSTKGRMKLIILDEADNLFGREDYGGAKAIVDTIRETSQPIILIVNDYYELSRKASAIKTLADKVTFNRMDRHSVVGVLGSICTREGVSFDAALLDKIAVNAGGDLRAAVNDLQMLFEGRTSVLAGESDMLGKRNQEKELNQALRAVFGAKTVREARDATLDLDLTPEELEKWIEENIPQEYRSTDELIRAFDSLSRSDVYLGRTRRLQHYGLWSYAKEMMTGGVALSRGSMPRPQVMEYRFPSFFMMMSRAKGRRAAREAVSRKLGAQLRTSWKRVNESSLPYLSAIAKRDEEFLLKLCLDAELDEGDVAFILDTDPDSAAVTRVIARAKEVRTGETAGPASGKRSKKSPGKRSLADF